MKINYVYREGNAFTFAFRKTFVDELEKMGHEVRAYVSAFHQRDFSDFLPFLKTPCDLLIIIGGGDKYYPLFNDKETMDYVRNLKVPKLGVMIEGSRARTSTLTRFLLTMPLWTHVLTPDEVDVPLFESYGIKTMWNPCIVDDKFFKPLNIEKTIDCDFIGRIHKCRVDIVQHLKDNLGIQNNSYPTDEEYVVGINKSKMLISLLSPFKGFTTRVPEIMACKTLMLHPELQEAQTECKKVFEDKKEIVYYKNKEELVELAKYYLEHEDERNQIIENAYNKVINEYSVSLVAKKIMDFIK